MAKAAAAASKDKKPAPKTAKDTKARAPSAYNQFMKAKLTDYKKAHPNLDHKAAFTAVAGLWATAPENPNRKK